MLKNIVLIQFSGRKEGNCSAIADVIGKFHHDKTVQSYIIDANTMPACSNCDYECLVYGKTCPNLTQEQSQIYDAVCNSEITYMIIPNYCGYPCANYFAYNERSVGFFNMDRELMDKYMNAKKRFIILSNTESDNFVNALKQQSDNPVIQYLKTGQYGKCSIAGNLMEAEAAKNDLIAFLKACSI